MKIKYFKTTYKMDCKGKIESNCNPPECRWVVTKKGSKYCRKAGKTAKKGKKTKTPPKSGSVTFKKKSGSKKSNSKTKTSKKKFCGPTPGAKYHTPKMSHTIKKTRKVCKTNEIFNDLADKCVKRDSMLGVLAEAKSLYTYKIKNPLQLKGPVQQANNCWFNSVLTALFISDLGRKFTKDARHHMIFKVDKDGKNISNKYTRKAFKTLNERIDNILKYKAEKTGDIIAQLHKGGYELDEGEMGTPNEFIQELYPPFGLENHYEEIFGFASGKTTIKNLILDNYEQQKNAAQATGVSYIQPKPKQYAVYIYGEMAGLFLKEKEFMLNDQKYKLDSAIIHDQSGIHYGCTFTCNGKGYLYDGFGKNKKTVSQINWLNKLNKNETFSISSYRFNFMNCALLLFYYAVE